MKHTSTLALFGCVVGALALSGCGSKHHEPVPPPQRGRAAARTVDPALAERGRRVFVNRGCNACHTIGRTEARTAEGPDLAGVTERRTNEWLVAWLKDPNAMFGSDPVADAMLEQYRFVKMPNMRLADGEISALIAYLAQFPQR
jgi:cbb3-type cytochrome oxidase cytochrome c subunit